jgi:hypothetical protein
VKTQVCRPEYKGVCEVVAQTMYTRVSKCKNNKKRGDGLISPGCDHGLHSFVSCHHWGKLEDVHTVPFCTMFTIYESMISSKYKGFLF